MRGDDLVVLGKGGSHGGWGVVRGDMDMEMSVCS